MFSKELTCDCPRTFDRSNKRIFDYEANDKFPIVTAAKNIGPYLIEGEDLALPIRKSPICSAPPIVNGNKPADGGHLIIEDDEKNEFLEQNPSIAPYLKPFLCADQYLNNKKRWVLWLVDAPPEVVRANSGVVNRLNCVAKFRESSPKESTRRMATKPSLFDQIRQPRDAYIVIPRHSSVNRKYIPFGYFNPDVIIGDSCTAVPNASYFHFGVLSSAIHMAWVKQVCGRLKSDFRYSNKLVYNNFPWPQNPTEKQKANIEAKAQVVLDSRKKYPESSLADLYDPLTMPPDLVKAHDQLDRAVEQCYRSKPFTSDRERVEFLFDLYEKLAATPLLPEEPKKRTRKKS